MSRAALERIYLLAKSELRKLQAAELAARRFDDFPTMDWSRLTPRQRRLLGVAGGLGQDELDRLGRGDYDDQ